MKDSLPIPGDWRIKWKFEENSNSLLKLTVIHYEHIGMKKKKIKINNNTL